MTTVDTSIPPDRPIVENVLVRRNPDSTVKQTGDRSHGSVVLNHPLDTSARLHRATDALENTVMEKAILFPRASSDDGNRARRQGGYVSCHSLAPVRK